MCECIAQVSNAGFVPIDGMGTTAMQCRTAAHQPVVAELDCCQLCVAGFQLAVGLQLFLTQSPTPNTQHPSKFPKLAEALSKPTEANAKQAAECCRCWHCCCCHSFLPLFDPNGKCANSVAVDSQSCPLLSQAMLEWQSWTQAATPGTANTACG